MDSPLCALKFSEDLIYQIVKKHDAVKSCEKWDEVRKYLEKYQKERCSVPVHEAVLGLMEHRKESIQRSFDELCKVRVFSVLDFRFELSLTAIMYFTNGYEHFKFLNYCALLGGLAVRYAKAGHHEIPGACAQLLGYFLNFWIYSLVFKPNTDYFELACVAQRVRRNLQVKQIKELPKKGEESKNRQKEGGDDGKRIPSEKGDKEGPNEEIPKGESSTMITIESDDALGKPNPEKQKVAEKKNVAKAEEGKNLPKKKGSEKGKGREGSSSSVQHKSDEISEKAQGGDGMPAEAQSGDAEKAKGSKRRPRKSKKGGKK